MGKKGNRYDRRAQDADGLLLVCATLLDDMETDIKQLEDEARGVHAGRPHPSRREQLENVSVLKSHLIRNGRLVRTYLTFVRQFEPKTTQQPDWQAVVRRLETATAKWKEILAWVRKSTRPAKSSTRKE